MRIAIELELQPEEIPLATELFNVLQKIAGHIRPKNTRGLYEQLFKSLEDQATQPDAVASQLNQLLSMQPVEEADATCNDLMGAFAAVVFTPDFTVKKILSERFVAVLPMLVQPYGFNFLTKLVLHIVKELSLPREVDCDRLDFYSIAETMAFLVKLNLINVEVMLKTVINMLPKEQMRAAGLTALGKIIEFNLDSLASKCSESVWMELEQALQHTQENVLNYDLTYIRDNLASKGINIKIPYLSGGASAASTLPAIPPPLARTNTPSSAAVARPTGSITPTAANLSLGSSSSSSSAPGKSPPGARTGVQKIVGLLPKESMSGHSERIFNVVYDDTNNILISSSEGGLVLGRNRFGQTAHSTLLPGFFSCGIDVSPKTNALLIAGKELHGTNNKPSILAYDLNASNGTLINQGIYPKQSVKVISAIKGLGNRAFVTGEVVKATKQTNMCVYDFEKLSHMSEPKPVYVWSEHKDLIICFARHTDHEQILFSGSKDKTVHVWDLRQSQPAAVLMGHSETVATISVQGNSILSGDLKQNAFAWDMRNILQPVSGVALKPTSSTNVKYGVVKILHTSSSNMAVLSTPVNGVHLLDIDQGKLSSSFTYPGSLADKSYVEMAWDTAKTTLYCGGTDGNIDIFEPLYENL